MVAFLVSRIGFTEGTEQCRPSESSVYGMFLKGHTFTSVQTRIPAECQMKCEEEARCQSFNVILGSNICELNSRTKEARPEDLVPDLDRIYMKRAFNRGTVAFAVILLRIVSSLLLCLSSTHLVILWKVALYKFF